MKFKYKHLGCCILGILIMLYVFCNDKTEIKAYAADIKSEIVYKENNNYYTVDAAGNAKYADIDRNKDYYFKIAVDIELVIDSELVMYVTDEHGALAEYHFTCNRDIDYGSEGVYYYAYIPISSMIRELQGNVQICYELLLANGQLYCGKDYTSNTVFSMYILGDYIVTYDANGAGGATITGYNGSETKLVIPSEIDGYPVTSIDGNAFYGCSSLTSIVIPEGVTSIGGGAFSGCSSLESITIPKSVTSIGSYAFYNCENLTEITIPENVTKIGSYTFAECRNLVNIIMSERVVSMGAYVFSGCSSLESIIIPKSVTSIDSHAFYYCRNLTSITIPEGVTSIADYTFGDCSSLTDITIPKSVTSIGEDAFNNCSATLEFACYTQSAAAIYAQQKGFQISYLDVSTVKYDANGGAGAPSSQTKTQGITLTLSNAKPSRIGYEFLGWSTSSSATSASYSAGGNYTADSDVVLYAVWQVKAYIVSYDANGGSGEPVSQTKTHGNTLIISSEKPNKRGYTFKGWSASNTDSTVTYQPGDNYTNNESITLYAVWEKEKEPVIEAKPQTITASSRTVSYGSTAFNLNAKTNGDGKLTYTSSNKKVVIVDQNGKIKAKDCGTAIITINVSATNNYKAATKKITITVNPKKVTLKKISSTGKKKLSAEWKKDSKVTGYQVMFSTSKKFAKDTYERSFKKSATKFSVVGVKSGKKYYVKVRAYKTVKGTKYYGEWSKVKSVKIN